MTTQEIIDMFSTYQKQYNEASLSIIREKYGLSEKEYNEKITTFSDTYINDILCQPLIESLESDEFPNLNKVRFILLPCENINASVLKSDDNDYFIILNDRLFGLIHSWNEIQIQSAFEFLKKEDSYECFARNFAKILECYKTKNSGNILPILKFDEIPFEVQAMILTKTIENERFVLAHELAHIFLNHFENFQNKIDFKEDIFIFSSYAENQSQQKEFDADVQAIKWLIQFYKKNNKLQLLLSSLEVFVIFHFLECNTFFPSSNDKHPPSLSRLINIRKNFLEYLSDDIYDIDDMISNCKDIDSFRIT